MFSPLPHYFQLKTNNHDTIKAPEETTNGSVSALAANQVSVPLEMSMILKVYSQHSQLNATWNYHPIVSPNFGSRKRPIVYRLVQLNIKGEHLIELQARAHMESESIS